MNAAADPIDIVTTERRLSGTTLAFLAFVTGTLVALLPVYYIYTSRDSAGRSIAAPVERLPSTASPTVSSERAESPTRFAARMTYELSHTPAELPPTPVRAAAPSETVAAKRESFAPPPQPALEPAPRVANARPISAAPPDPRDTTREIEREARRSEYREPPRQLAQVTLEPAPAKVIEGRDFVLPGKPVATRPIAAPDPSSSKRVETVAAGRVHVATAGLVAGANPIGPPPEDKAEPQKAPAEPLPVAGDVLKTRLSATREWLAGAAQNTHTIQLMGGTSEAQLRGQLKVLAKLLDPGKIYVIRTLVQGKPGMTVLYGAYPDRQAALQALEKLPAPVAANRPVLRTVNGIRAEQKQHGTDS